jgi:hypothetical protein
MAPYESSFKYEDVKTKIGSIGALGATHHPTEKMHHQILPISKVFVASNDRPVDGIFLILNYLLLSLNSWLAHFMCEQYLVQYDFQYFFSDNRVEKYLFGNGCIAILYEVISKGNLEPRSTAGVLPLIGEQKQQHGRTCCLPERQSDPSRLSGAH